MKVEIYTDGGADPNPGAGGWAAIVVSNGHERVLTGHEACTTNNRMELQAAIAALSALEHPSTVEIHTDSTYLKRGMSEWVRKWQKDGWQRKGKPVQNADLWKELWRLGKRHEVTWNWVRGHSGHPFNERVDRLARSVRQSAPTNRDSAPEFPKLFVRASCIGNPGPGGWGLVLETGEERIVQQGSDGLTTNNRMELEAVIAGLQLAPDGSEPTVFTTSDYVQQGATRWLAKWRKRNWRTKAGKPLANSDLWQELDAQLARRQVYWVKEKEMEDQEVLQEAARLASQAARREA